VNARAIRAGIGVDKSRQRLRLGEHSIAPLLDLRKARAGRVRASLRSRERCFERFGIDIAHQLADELELTPPAFVLRNAAGLRDRIRQPLRQREVGQSAGSSSTKRSPSACKSCIARLRLRFGRLLRGIIGALLSLFGRETWARVQTMQMKRGRIGALCYDTQHALRTARGALARTCGATFARKGHR
jgi:hypothetical protein